MPAGTHEHVAGELGRLASRAKSKAHPSVFVSTIGMHEGFFFSVSGFF